MAMAEPKCLLDLQLLQRSYVIDDVELLMEEEPIGQGSYAKVYRGEWKGIPVAVKKLHGVFFDDTVAAREKDGILATFHKELSMSISLRHPNIIQCLGICYAGGDQHTPMMVMELMETTLERKLNGLQDVGTRMPLHEVADIAIDVAAGLVYLHEQDPKPIAHRDLAPKNVLLSTEGRAKLCDLGVAKATNLSKGNTMGPGTPAFMPPEVIISKNYSPTPVDIYSFGVTLLEMCSSIDSNPGELFHMADSGLQYVMIPERQRREASFVALGSGHLLEKLISRCLETLADARPKAREVLKCLKAVKETPECSMSRQTAAKSVGACEPCREKQERIEEMQRRLDESNSELEGYRTEIEKQRSLHKQSNGQLTVMQQQIETLARDAQKHQDQVQELNDVMKKRIEANASLQETNEMRMHCNKLLRHKVEMDSHPDRFSNPPPRTEDKKVQSGSFKRPNVIKPKPKPRRRTICKSPVEPEKKPLERSGPDTQETSSTYLKLDAAAMIKNSGLYENREHAMRVRGESASSTDSRSSTSSPDGHQEHLYVMDNGGDHMYSEIPDPKPPVPPLRPFLRKPHTWHIKNKKDLFPGGHGMPKIIETDEDPPSLAVPEAQAREFSGKTGRKVQSMKARIHSPVSPIPSPVSPSTDGKRPPFLRQGSRGDVLIFQVVKSYKSKNLQALELTVTKGELVKVTNTAMDKKWCIAVTTTGMSGSVKKKHLENVEPAPILYDVTNPAKSRQNGIINRIASSNKQDEWTSPVESQEITITPSSLHTGDVNMLVKMSECLLCCTDRDKQSSFEIDVSMKRLVKLTGYVLQCHYEGINGYPKQWRLEGSHNGNTWAILSEESCDSFEKAASQYFEVTTPIPSRYFRLVQLARNSAGNHRFCLSGIELYGHLYSSCPQEMYGQK